METRRRHVATLSSRDTIMTSVNNNVTMTTTSLTSHWLTTINIATVAMVTTTAVWASSSSRLGVWMAGWWTTKSRGKFVEVARRSPPTSYISWREPSTRHNTLMCSHARNWRLGLISARHEFRSVTLIIIIIIIIIIIPWKDGRCVTWDVTVTDAMAQFYLPLTSQASGACSSRSRSGGGQEDSQVCLIDRGIFVHTDCSWNHGSYQQRRYWISRRLGRRIAQVTDDNREKAFLYQRLSVLIQRYNAVAILGTFAHTTPEDEI